MYEYKLTRNQQKELRKISEGIIQKVQKEVKQYFTFSFKLIGSGESRLMLVNDQNIDLDYNLLIQKDKTNLISNPSRIKDVFFNAFKKVVPNASHNKNKTNVIKYNYGNIFGYFFSFDIAILVEWNDGYQYKLIYDKNGQRFFWNKVANSKDFEYRFQMAKKNHFDKIQKLYKDYKNKYLKNNVDKASFSILIEAVNEVIQKYKIQL